MLSIFKKKNQTGKKIDLHIDGMHCTSCSLNIDGSLEDMEGVLDSHTSYAKSKTVVHFDPQIINQEEIEKKIQEAGYTTKKK